MFRVRDLRLAQRALSRRHPSARLASTFRVSDEVKDAVNSGKPVVALETTIVTHGLPYPENYSMALAVEQVVRKEGAIPATTAFLGGEGVVGLTTKELELLATSKNVEKVSRRDIPHIIAHKLNGGTTIAGTMILSHRAGVKVFATGGLGGVHRGVAGTWDISADLEELARTPVSVVCSGPKSILDVPKTLEYLETKGVPVATLGTGGVPGFFTVDSGVPSPYNFSSPEEAARLIRAGLRFGGLSGSVFCVPAPAHLALNRDMADAAVQQALSEAELKGISGKDLTPFLLTQIWKITGGDSVAVNVEFVKNNAKVAARISSCLEGLSEQNSSSMRPDQQTIRQPVVLKPRKVTTLKPQQEQTQNVVVVGALGQDLTCTLDTTEISVSSYPGRIHTSLGGTAHNIALASAYSGASTRLVSSVGEKEKDQILASISPYVDFSGVQITKTGRTARYVSMNDSNGDLIVACSDMDTIAKLSEEWITAEIERASPRVVVFDGNLGIDAVTSLLENSKDSLTVFEPTSVPKAGKIADIPDLGVFPNASIDIATPNTLELMSMFEQFSYKERFDVTRWFPIVDALPMTDPLTQMKLDIFLRSDPSLNNLVQSGLFQAAIHLLPYIPNLFITAGQHGVLSFQLIEHLKDRTAGVRGSAKASFYVLSSDQPFGLLVQHFPIPETLDPELARSVNGIGDTFCGSLVAQLARDRSWLRDDGPTKREAIDHAQRAACLSLQTYESVSSLVADMTPPEKD